MLGWFEFVWVYCINVGTVTNLAIQKVFVDKQCLGVFQTFVSRLTRSWMRDIENTWRDSFCDPHKILDSLHSQNQANHTSHKSMNHASHKLLTSGCVESSCCSRPIKGPYQALQSTPVPWGFSNIQWRGLWPWNIGLLAKQRLASHLRISCYCRHYLKQ